MSVLQLFSLAGIFGLLSINSMAFGKPDEAVGWIYALGLVLFAISAPAVVVFIARNFR